MSEQPLSLRLAWCFLFGVAGCMATGCGKPKPHWKLAAEHLDAVARHVEEYGTITVSEPLIIEDKGQFAVDYGRGVKEYIDAARTGVQGAMRTSREQALDVQFGLGLQGDLLGLTGGLEASQPSSGAGLGALRRRLTDSTLSIETLQDLHAQIGVMVPPEVMTREQKAVYEVIGGILSRAAPADPQLAAAKVLLSAASEDAGAEPTPEAVENGGEGSPLGAGPDTDEALHGTEEGVAVEQTPPAFANVLPGERAAKAVLSTERFSPPLAIGQLPTQISERQALLIGINDKVTENILKYLVHPGPRLAEDYAVLLEVLQVSCQPGWRTREGYVADINVTTFFAKENSSGEFVSSRLVSGQAKPVVVSVFPSLESQTLDLRSSVRNQAAFATQLALMLQGGGAEAAARLLTDYAERLEYDAATRNAIPIITSYSDGTNFGFQIQPVFQALGEPARLKGEASDILQPATFPALVLVLLSRGEIRAGGWTHLEVMVNSRWIPRKRASGPPIREATRLDLARRLDQALAEWGKTSEPPPHGDGLSRYSNTYDELRRRYNLYQALGVGLTRYSVLFSEKAPVEPQPDIQITSVYPDHGWANATTLLAIEGENFSHQGKSVVKQVTVGGVNCDFVVTGNTTLVATVPANAFSLGESAEIVVVSTQNVAASDAGGSAIQVTFDRERPVHQPVPAVSVERDGEGRVMKIIIQTDAVTAGRDGVLINALRDILEKEKCCDNVDVQVSSSSTLKKPGS